MEGTCERKGSRRRQKIRWSDGIKKIVDEILDLGRMMGEMMEEDIQQGLTFK